MKLGKHGLIRCMRVALNRVAWKRVEMAFIQQYVENEWL